MQTLVLFTLACLLGTAYSQASVYGCNVNINRGSPVFINNTADLTLYSPCTALPGIIFGNGDLGGSVVLGNLTNIIRTTDGDTVAQTGIQILSTQFTSISFPALTNFRGTFIRIIGNNLLTSLSIGTNTVVNDGASFGTQIVIQSNPVLVDPVIRIDSLGSQNNAIVTIGASTSGSAADYTGASGTVSLPFLTTAYSVTIYNNGISGNSKQLNVSLPSLTSLGAGINAVSNTYLTSLIVGTNGFVINGVNGGITLQSNPNLANANLNGLTSCNGPIRVDTNGNNGSPFSLVLDQLQYSRTQTGVFLIIQNNAGLSSISFAKLQYISSGITINNNVILSSLNLPGPIITSNLGYSGNGATNVFTNAIIGIQNTTSAGISITNSYFNQLVFPQLYYVLSNFDMQNNVIQGAVVANTTFTAKTAFTFSTKDATAITRLDFSGLASAGSISMNAVNGAGTATTQIRFDQLQVVVGAFLVTSVTNFNSIVFGKLVLAGSVSFSGNNFVTYDFGNGATNYWATNSFGLVGTNMQTINFGNLVTANSVSITLNSAATTTITASQLTCVNSFLVVTQGSSGLQSVSLPALTAFELLNVATGTGSCSVTVNSASTPCGSACAKCSNYNGTADCGGNNAAPASVTAFCASTTNDALTTVGCKAASPFSFSTTGATLLIPPTSSTPGGNGNPGTTTQTGNNNNNNNPSNSNNGSQGAATTVTNSNNNNNGGNPTRVSSATAYTASLFVVGIAIALAL